MYEVYYRTKNYETNDEIELQHKLHLAAWIYRFLATLTSSVHLVGGLPRPRFPIRSRHLKTSFPTICSSNDAAAACHFNYLCPGMLVTLFFDQYPYFGRILSRKEIPSMDLSIACKLLTNSHVNHF